ncbi:hypothetical protein SDC9_105255 [bioreactor metagenome]|uniref:Uncharacterized protein n=1 Tax=bioreactor metagenome TaxID=1076179 RepID=A0A645B9S6_9ZZZZ
MGVDEITVFLIIVRNGSRGGLLAAGAGPEQAPDLFQNAVLHPVAAAHGELVHVVSHLFAVLSAKIE